MKKIIVLILALVMVISVFAACGKGNTPTTPNKTTPKLGDDPSDPADDETPEDQKINLDLDNIDYDGETVTVYHWIPQESNCEEFGMNAEDINNDSVKDSIFQRNTYAEEALGICFEWIAVAGSFIKMDIHADKIRARLSDPNTPVDLIACMTKGMPCLITEGLLTDLNMYSDSLDLSKAWWPENCQDALAVKHKLYFVSGDVSANLLRMMTVLFVNKQVLAAHGHSYEQLMADVKDYTWTIDDLIAMNTGIYEDLDTVVSGPSLGDKFGLVTTYFHTDALYAGFGYKYATKSNKDNEVFRYSTQIVGETAVNYVTRMQNWAQDHNLWLDPSEKEYRDVFANGDAMFSLDRTHYGFLLQQTDINYAVIPTPAFDEAQGRYYTNIGGQFSAYGMCVGSPDYDRAAQALQTLGYFALTTTTPAIFEVSFQGKFSKDQYTIEMFDIIRESVIFDMGRIYEYYIVIQSGIMDKYTVPYLLTNIISLPIEEMRQFTFNSSGDPTRRLLDGCIEMANDKLLDYIEQ